MKKKSIKPKVFFIILLIDTTILLIDVYMIYLVDTNHEKENILYKILSSNIVTGVIFGIRGYIFSILFFIISIFWYSFNLKYKLEEFMTVKKIKPLIITIIVIIINIIFSLVMINDFWNEIIHR
jgi:hypothetical protein